MDRPPFRTLVVDDEPQIRKLTARALSLNGFDCDLAADGEEALQFYRSRQHDLVITDLRMPRRHGHSLVVELLNEQEPPRVVVFTGLAEPRLVQDLLDRGVQEVFTKPVNFDVLATKLHNMLGRDDWNANNVASKSQPSRLQMLGRIEQVIADLTEVFADRLMDVFDPKDELPDPPVSVDNIIKRFEASECNDEQSGAASERKKQRAIVACTAIAVPMDRMFQVRGDAFKLTIRDVSESGVRLLHTRATNADYLGLSWQAETIPYQQLAVPTRVMRCRPQCPFYDIGCQFVLAD